MRMATGENVGLSADWCFASECPPTSVLMVLRSGISSRSQATRTAPRQLVLGQKKQRWGPETVEESLIDIRAEPPKQGPCHIPFNIRDDLGSLEVPPIRDEGAAWDYGDIDTQTFVRLEQKRRSS